MTRLHEKRKWALFFYLHLLYGCTLSSGEKSYAYMTFPEVLFYFEDDSAEFASELEFQMNEEGVTEKELEKINIADYGHDFAVAEDGKIIAVNLRESTFRDDLVKIIRLNSGNNPFEGIYPHLYNCDSLVPVLELIFDSDQQVNNPRIDWTKNIDSLNDQRTFSIVSGCSLEKLSSYDYRNLTGLFLAVQHSNREIIAYFYPYFLRAVERGVFKKEDLALLTDRLLLGHGYPQVYGSQVNRDGTLTDLRNGEQLDSLRNTMGLGPIKEYLKFIDSLYAGR